jgi:PsbP
MRTPCTPLLRCPATAGIVIKHSMYMQAFVITLARAGEDKVFKLSDPDSTFSSFAGADYDLQDAVTSADGIDVSTREENGRKFYDYVVEGSNAVYYVTVTVDMGKVFAFFVSSPAKSFSRSKPTMAKMIRSFDIIA